MTDWRLVNCRECRKCNRKGLPSVSKGSKVCEERRGIITPERKTGWGNFVSSIQPINIVFKIINNEIILIIDFSIYITHFV